MFFYFITQSIHAAEATFTVSFDGDTKTYTLQEDETINDLCNAVAVAIGKESKDITLEAPSRHGMVFLNNQSEKLKDVKKQFGHFLYARTSFDMLTMYD